MSKKVCITLFPEVETVTRKLSDEQFGTLMRAVMAYGFREEAYIGEDAALDIAFQFMANQVDRMEAIKTRNTKAAEMRWNAKRMQTDATDMPDDAPILSVPVLSNPVLSVPVQSSPVTQKDIHCNANSKCIQGAAAPVHAGKKSFGKFGWIKLSQQEYDALVMELGETELQRCIAYLDESCQTNGNKNRWKDFGLVIARCSKEGWGLNHNVTRNEEIPKGASGVLGEAEREAIQRVLRGE